MEVMTKITKLEDTVRVQAQLLTLAPELAKGKIFDCIIKQHRERRSLDANSYFHLLVGKIAEKMQTGADEMKVKMNLEYGTPATQKDGSPIIVKMPKEVEISQFYPYAKWYQSRKEKNGTECNYYLFYKQTHTLDTKEMARLIDGVVYEAQQLGIETRTPNELAEMKSLWGKKV